MKNMDKEFDNKMRDKLDGYHPEVPVQIWDRIKNELDNKQETVVLGVQEPRKFNWSKWSAAAVILIAVGVLYFTTNQTPEVIYLSNHTSDNSATPPAEVELQPVHSPDKSVEPGGKKLSEDIRTISRVLATTLQATEKKIRVSDDLIAQEADQFAINLEPTQLNEVETVEMQFVENTFEKSIPLTTPLTEIQDLHTEIQANELALNSNKTVENTAEAQTRSRFGVGRLLNLMVAQIDRRDEKFISFSNDEEGSLKIDFNLAQVKK